MTQRDRDRLVVLRKAQKKLITQNQAARELEMSERHVRRLLVRLRESGDKSVIHGLRGRESNRRLSAETREKAVRILSEQVYRGFGPTLAREYLAKKHKLAIGRETLRQLMRQAGLWRSRRQKVEAVHQWRQRRSARGEMVQWDTSEHDWLEGRGERLYLIHMIDDATSELLARFVPSDSTEQNMRLLRTYLERHGRPLSFYTDKASMFHTTPKVSRSQTDLARNEREPPPTQIGRALRELNIVWIAAHSPQAKGRVERSFGTAQDRLVKGLRVAGACTLDEANRYLETEFLPWWNQHLTVIPASAVDAHRPLEPEHNLEATLSTVETRQVNNDYTLQFHGRLLRIEPASIMAGLRGAPVRVEKRLNGEICVRFRERYLAVTAIDQRPAPAKSAAPAPPGKRKHPGPSPAARAAMNHLLRKPGMPVWAAGRIDNTRAATPAE
ncbi:MAG TPA: ISNCY family transposase [Candidatus Saccharimonadales bacterium]|nr:ISNCY family transposase [Candidatus Saccharimonadales bacterium]